MRNIIDIKNRSNSIRETAQITKAMEMISTSKLQKLNRRFLNNTVYFNTARATIKDILNHTDNEITHPYFNEHEGRKAAYIVIASDKGLAGDYNQKVLNLALKEVQKKKEKYILIIGQMAREFFMLRDMHPDVEYLYAAQDPTLEDARRITEDLMEMYDNGLIDSINIVYTKMQSATIQEPVVLRLLPVQLEDFLDIEDEADYIGMLDFEPSPKEVIEILVPQYILGIVYSCLIQSVYSEHYERMKTMHNATINANKLMEKLELEYNRVRQEIVTREISEISSSLLFRKG